MAERPMIEMRGVGKWFGRFQVLKDIDLSVGAGEKIVLCGPSGSGKSTLVRLVNALEPYQAGKVVVDGIEHAPRVGDRDERALAPLLLAADLGVVDALDAAAGDDAPPAVVRGDAPADVVLASLAHLLDPLGVGEELAGEAEPGLAAQVDVGGREAVNADERPQERMSGHGRTSAPWNRAGRIHWFR